MDSVMIKFFNDPIIVDEWFGIKNSYPILIIGTQSMGGYIDGGKGKGGWKPAQGEQKEIKSNELMEVFNEKLNSKGFSQISSLNGHVAVCNVFDKDPVNIPLNIPPEDYKCDEPFGDTTSGEETPDVILSKIINNSEWIYNKLREGKHVFVHCNAGASRSPTVVVKMLIDKLGMSIYRAIDIVKMYAPKMHGNDRVNINNFKDLLLREVEVRAVPEPEPEPEPEPDMVSFGAAQAEQEDTIKREIRTILEKIDIKNATINTLESEGFNVSTIKADIDQLKTRLNELMFLHSGGGKKRKSKKRKSKKRKSKRRKSKKDNII